MDRRQAHLSYSTAGTAALAALFLASADRASRVGAFVPQTTPSVRTRPGGSLSALPPTARSLIFGASESSWQSGTVRSSAVLRMSTDGGDDGDATGPATDEESLDQYLSSADLRGATRTLKAHPSIPVPKERFLGIFDAIETRTSEAEENDISNNRAALDNVEYPPTSPARNEMTKLYNTLHDLGHLRIFGAAGRDGRPLPAMGSKSVTPTLLEQITSLSMISLTPKPTNTLLIAGVALAVLEGFVSLSTGIELNFLVLSTVTLALMDRILVNGAVFETATKIVMPEYRKKVLRHEAGHFLCAYLLGCPVEGCVLSSWAALKDARFGGRQTAVSAGTSFFDPDLSEEINGRKPLSRSSIDRYSIIVMGGIAAEAVNFGRADGGAGDEMALVRFLTSVNPRGGGAVSWDAERIKNQARWGAMQAVLLLKEYRASYDALVDALERGGSLGDCIYAIENAAKEKDEKPLGAPLGYILERGLYGEWTTAPPPDMLQDAGAATQLTNRASNSENPAPPTSSQEEVIASSKESLDQIRRATEEKLKAIDEQLSKIEKGTDS